MNVPLYQEDDDLDLERELADLERNTAEKAREMGWMNERGREIRKTLEAKQMDPVVKEALRLAQLAGHALGANEALGNKLNNLVKRIEVRDQTIEEMSDYYAIKDSLEKMTARAEKAEQLHKNLKNSRRRY